MDDPQYFLKKDLFTPNFHNSVYPVISPENPLNNLTGKTAIITGAARGLGRTMTISLLSAGASVIILARNTTALDEFHSELKTSFPNASITPATVDISSLTSVRSFFATLTTVTPTILINNAGICSNGHIGKGDDEQWALDWDVNVKGTYFMSSNFLRLLDQRGEGKASEATIVNLTSGWYPLPAMSAYLGSKMQVARLTECLEVERGEEGLVSYAVHPGIVNTDMCQDGMEFFALDDPTLVAGLIVYLSAQRPRYLSGRWISSNWDVEDLEKRKDEIVKDGLLKMVLTGKFGPEQFQ